MYIEYIGGEQQNHRKNSSTKASVSYHVDADLPEDPAQTRPGRPVIGRIRCLRDISATSRCAPGSPGPGCAMLL